MPVLASPGGTGPQATVGPTKGENPPPRPVDVSGEFEPYEEDRGQVEGTDLHDATSNRCSFIDSSF